MRKQVDQQQQEKLIKQRLRGKLPVIKIMGHLFYVDLFMNMLRAKDDFINLGIHLDDLENWYNQKGDSIYLCYDPKTHTHKELDFTTITEIPEGLHFIKIPSPERMDPIGYARLHGWDMEDILKQHPIIPNMVAKLIPWNRTPFLKIIRENEARAERQKLSHPQSAPLQRRPTNNSHRPVDRKSKKDRNIKPKRT